MCVCVCNGTRGVAGRLMQQRRDDGQVSIGLHIYTQSNQYGSIKKKSPKKKKK